MEYNIKFKSKSFHTLVFVLAILMVLQCRLHLCWGAPVTDSVVNAVEDDINSNTTINDTTATLDVASSSEEQGDEFADLQELRAGLKVLNTIAKNRLALRLQLSDKGKTALDAANNSTGIRLALSVTCNLRKAAEAFDDLPLALNGSAPQSANLTLLRVATDALFKSACLWVDALYRAQNPNLTTSFNCSCHKMDNICSNLDILVFTERLEQQYHTLQSLLLNETRWDSWIQENIEADSVLPEVYNIINQQ